MSLAYSHPVVLISALAALFSSAASAQIIINGSFESQGIIAATTATSTPNTSAFTGWTIATSSGSVGFQVVDTSFDSGFFPDAPAGSIYMAINGGQSTAGVGLIYQDFATTIGQTYSVSFSAGRGSNGSGVVGIQGDVYNVISGSTSGGSLGTASSTSSAGGSRFYSASAFTFTATGATSRIVFSDVSTSTSGVDALLDNVSVSAVPEPSSFAALAGFAALGLGLQRRRRATVA